MFTHLTGLRATFLSSPILQRYVTIKKKTKIIKKEKKPLLTPTQTTVLPPGEFSSTKEAYVPISIKNSDPSSVPTERVTTVPLVGTEKTKTYTHLNLRTTQEILSTRPSLPPPWRVLFFGTDAVSLETLRALHVAPSSLVSRLEAVTKPYTEYLLSEKRTSVKVALYCLEHNIPLHLWPEEGEGTFQVPEGFDIGIVVSFGSLIPEAVIETFPFKMLNMHPSILPKYRGPAPIRHALLNNDTETGVTVIDLHPTKFDQGNIFLSARMNIELTDNHYTLLPRVAKLGATKILDTLQNFHELNTKKRSQASITQGEDSKQYAGKISKGDYTCPWTSADNLKVYGHWRALPLQSFTFFQQTRLRIEEMRLPTEIPKEVREAEYRLRLKRKATVEGSIVGGGGGAEEEDGDAVGGAGSSVGATESGGCDKASCEEINGKEGEKEKGKERGNKNVRGYFPAGVKFGQIPDPFGAGLMVYCKPERALYVRCLVGWVVVTKVLIASRHKWISAAEFVGNFNIRFIPEPRFTSQRTVF
eukprot:TRINITY_DN7597_c0_g1_i2.p1 TRINITY_DN7597_c0_g1~~TRINITY_DN7597_c0_g1_i2.p1  ORF type:complete len:530 (-),score=102.68 TRINITY_DN7597_c0_g1_i2:445-2034(-)